MSDSQKILESSVFIGNINPAISPERAADLLSEKLGFQVLYHYIEDSVLFFSEANATNIKLMSHAEAEKLIGHSIGFILPAGNGDRES